MKSWKRNETYRLGNSCFANEPSLRQNNLQKLFAIVKLLNVLFGTKRAEIKFRQTKWSVMSCCFGLKGI